MLVNMHGRPVSTEKRQVPVTDPRLFEYLSWADPLLPNHGMVIACQHCKTPLGGQNHPSDAVWVLECDCSRWEWRRASDRVSPERRN